MEEVGKIIGSLLVCQNS